MPTDSPENRFKVTPSDYKSLERNEGTCGNCFEEFKISELNNAGYQLLCNECLEDKSEKDGESE